MITLAVNSRELNVFVSVTHIQVERRHSPLASFLVPVRFRANFLQLKTCKGYLHDVVSELEIFIELSNRFEKVFLGILILSLQVLDLSLRIFILFSKLLDDVSHIIDLFLEVFVLSLDQ